MMWTIPFFWRTNNRPSGDHAIPVRTDNPSDATSSVLN